MAGNRRGGQLLVISGLWPEPAVVILAGHTCQVSQYQLRDLAALERWALSPSTVWESLEAAQRVEDQHARREGLKAAFELAEDKGRWFGSSEVAVALASPLGRLECLWRSLHKGERTLTRIEVAPLAQKLSEADWQRFERVAWDSDPLDECWRAIDREIGAIWSPGRPGTEPKWLESILEACQVYHWTIEEIGDLYLSQWATITGGGNRESAYSRPGAVDLPKGWSWDRMLAEVLTPRREFWKANGTQATV